MWAKGVAAMAKAFLQVALVDSGDRVFLAVDAVQAVRAGSGEVVVTMGNGDEYHVDLGGLPADAAAAGLAGRIVEMSRDMADIR